MSRARPLPPIPIRPLTAYERGAMWLFHDEYAADGCSAIDFWTKLPNSKQRLVLEMVADIRAALKTGERRNAQ